MSVDSIKL